MTQFSPDGHWWWDGTAWRPASEAPGLPWTPTAPAVHDAMAIASVVLGVLGFPLPILAPVALGMGIASTGSAKKNRRATSGFAVAGIILGAVGSVLLVLGAFFLLFFFMSLSNG